MASGDRTKLTIKSYDYSVDWLQIVVHYKFQQVSYDSFLKVKFQNNFATTFLF